MNKHRKTEVILFPTDTIPGIGCFLSGECVRRLRETKKRPKDKPFALLLSDKEAIREWVREVPDIYQKLSRFLPGGLTLIFKGKSNLPEGVISKEGKVGIRIPNYEPLRDIIRDAGVPLITTSANLSGEPCPLHVDDVKLEYDRVVPGEFGSGKVSTVLDISGDIPVLKRPGEISILEIENATGKEVLLGEGVSINILFVCSANMCRSPMAEAHLKYLTRDLKRVKVRSAGTRAIRGTPMSIGAKNLLEEEGLETHHQSISIAKPILEWADLIFVMEERHKKQLIDFSPESRGKIAFLRNFKEPSKPCEIEDPIGGGIEIYQRVFSEIKEANKLIEVYLKKKLSN